MPTEEKEHKFKGISYNSPFVLTFAIVSLFVLLLDIWTKHASTIKFFCVYRSRVSFPFFIRLFGHSIGHADWAHYLGNMSYFLLLGPGLEEKYGTKNLSIMCLITAIISGLIKIIFFPNTSLLGASGLVFMMIVLTSAASMKSGKIPITMILIIVIYVGKEIYTGITVNDNISQLTHVIGGVFGAIFGFAFRPKEEN